MYEPQPDPYKQPAAPKVGGASKAAYSAQGTGLENFNIPWDFGDSGGSAPSGSSGSIGGTNAFGSSGGIEMESSESSDVSGSSGGSNPNMDEMFMLQAQWQKALQDFGALRKQAKFFLPRTLQDIAGQYATQGSYFSSGRRGEQKEAAMKTQFDLQQAKRDLEFQKLQMMMQAKQLLDANDSYEDASGRSA